MKNIQEVSDKFGNDLNKSGKNKLETVVNTVGAAVLALTMNTGVEAATYKYQPEVKSLSTVTLPTITQFNQTDKLNVSRIAKATPKKPEATVDMGLLDGKLVSNIGGKIVSINKYEKPNKLAGLKGGVNTFFTNIDVSTQRDKAVGKTRLLKSKLNIAGFNTGNLPTNTGSTGTQNTVFLDAQISAKKFKKGNRLYSANLSDNTILNQKQIVVNESFNTDYPSNFSYIGAHYKGGNKKTDILSIGNIGNEGFVLKYLDNGEGNPASFEQMQITNENGVSIKVLESIEKGGELYVLEADTNNIYILDTQNIANGEVVGVLSSNFNDVVGIDNPSEIFVDPKTSKLGYFVRNFDVKGNFNGKGTIKFLSGQKVNDLFPGLEIQPNTAPTGQNITTSAGYANSFTLDLSSYLSDAEGNPVTAQIVGSGVQYGDIIVSGANITGNIATISVSTGTGIGYIDYQVTDGTDTNPTVYRITINSLDGI